MPKLDNTIAYLISKSGLTVGCLFSMLVIGGLLGVFWGRRKFLLSLLSLEFCVLGLYGGLSYVAGGLDESLYMGFYLLVFGACEASLGLSLLVTMTRLSGSDTLKHISALKC